MIGQTEITAQFLNQAQATLDNVRQTPAILATLSAHGYDEAHLYEGTALLATAMARHIAHNQAQRRLSEAVDVLNKARQATDSVYSAHRRLTNIVLRGDARRRRALGLDQPKLMALVGWIEQAALFYRNALSDAELLNVLAQFSVTPEDLAQAEALVQRVVALHAAHERAKVATQQATKERDVVLGALREWMTELQAVARIALADDVQQRETFQFSVAA